MSHSQIMGKLEEFEPGEDFETYKERLQIYFQINGIDDSKKALILLSLIGKNTYKILKSLVQPKSPSECNYNDLIKALQKYFSPRLNIRAERYKFKKIIQEEGQSIQEFIIRLKEVAQTCDFGDFAKEINTNTTKCCEKMQEHKPLQFKSFALDDALTDQFIAGVRNEEIQRALLNDSSLNFEKCCNVALTMEMSTKESKAIHPVVSTQFAIKTSSSSPQIKNSSESHKSKHSSISGKFGKCQRCGRHHNFKTCPAKNWKCYNCNRIGHTSVVCNQSKSHTSVKVIKSIAKVESTCVIKNIIVEDQPLPMELDTGACHSLISFTEYKSKFSYLKLQPELNTLITFTGQKLDVQGKISVRVEFQGQTYNLELIVVESSNYFLPLMGRTWLQVLTPHWREKLFGDCRSSVNKIEVNFVDLIKNNFPNVLTFKPNETIKDFEINIVLKENTTPIFHKAYSVPLRIKDKVEQELNRLVKNGTLIPVKSSSWASPIVCVPKSNGDIRICMDCRVTINKFIESYHHPLPLTEEIFASFANCNVFCVIDMSGAYNQLRVALPSRQLLTINTHIGLLQYTVLPFGVSMAPSAFQSTMDEILKNLKSTRCFVDDIVVGGKDESDCKLNCINVLKRLSEYNVKINLNKCRFLEKSVPYLGHILSNGKVFPNPEKVRAIVDAPAPTNLQQLQSYLGLLNYYNRFLPNLSSYLKDFYSLLKKNTDFVWSKNCQTAFETSKALITEHNVLELFDPSKPVIVATDASPYGVGAVLSHLIDGVEKPVLFASSSLSPSEKNYSQLHREALAIIFAVKKFHKYIFGKPFKICTDHQALKEIFSPRKGTAGVAAARLQRWAVILSMYDYDIEYRKSSQMQHADALSRLPLTDSTNVDSVGLINSVNLDSSNDSVIDTEVVQRETARDEVLSLVYNYVKRNKWPNKMSSEIKFYFRVRNSLAAEDNKLFYGDRLVIPSKLRGGTLSLLHSMNHLGIVKMKCMARSYVWWPCIERNIENFIKQCHICQSTMNIPKEKVNSRWYSCEYPFQRIHLDFFYFAKFQFLILVDAFSKYPDVIPLRSNTAEKLITILENFFATFGLPGEIVTDNGPPFGSFKFVSFCKKYGIKVSKSPPYHPQSNGLAERYVQTVKKVLKKNFLKNKNMDMQQVVSKFLFNQRNTPINKSLQTPSDLIFSFKPKIVLDNLNNKNQNTKNISKTVQTEQTNNFIKPKNGLNAINSFKNIKFREGEKILFKTDFRNDYVNWIPGIFLKELSALTCLIKIQSKVRIVHFNQIKKYNNKTNNTDIFNPYRYIVNETSGLSQDTRSSPSLNKSSSSLKNKREMQSSKRIINKYAKMNVSKSLSNDKARRSERIKKMKKVNYRDK